MPEEKIKVIVKRLPTYIAKFVSLSVKPTSFAYEQEFTIDYEIRNEGTGILDAFDVGAATIDDRPLRKVGDGSTQYIKLNPGETKSGSFVRKLMHDYPTTDLSLGSHSLEVLLFVTPEGADEPIDVSTDERKLPISLIAPPKPVTFEISDIEITPSEGNIIYVGKLIKVYIVVFNEGEIAAGGTAEVFVDGVKVKTASIPVIPAKDADGFPIEILASETAGAHTVKVTVAPTGEAVTDTREISYTASPPEIRPITVTATELRWTDGTYRAAFAIGNLVPATKYRVVLLDAEDNEIEANSVTGVSSSDIRADILKSDLDKFGYWLGCSVYNTDTGALVKREDYEVPPYEVKGNVDIPKSTIPTTIYLEESAVFDMMVENTGDREKEYAVLLTFKNVDSGEEFKFTPEYTVRVPAGGRGANRIAVVMPSEAIPMGEERATFDLIYKLEIW